MPYRRIPPEVKREAIALSDVVGVDAAAERLKLDPRSIHSWRQASGRRPELEAPQSTWRNLQELALAKVTTALTAGKVSPTQAATIAAIAERNAEKPEPVAEPPDEAQAWGDQVEAGLAGRFDVDSALAALIIRADDDLRNVEVKGLSTDAGDLLDIPAQVAWIESLGDLDEWHAAYRAARDAATDRVIEASREAQEAQKRAALIAEAQELIAAAEAFLAANAA